MSNGVRPSFDRTLTFAPLASSSFTLAASPAHHMRGVAPNSLAALGSAPASSRRRSTSGVPSAAAYMSGELPRASRAFGPRVRRSSFSAATSLLRIGR